MFYGQAMFIGGNSQKGLRYLSFPVYRCRVLWIQKTDFNLNNIIATLSLISISSVKKNSPANVLKRTQTDLNSARWMPKSVRIDAPSYAALTSQSLLSTIGLLQDNWPLFHYVIGISGILPYKHSSFFPPSHGSIMLPPPQSRVFARLARWQ